jgi:hypothetical protein
MTRDERAKDLGVAAMLAAAFLVASVGFTSGCRKEGPAERAGEKLDKAVEKVEDTLNPPGPAEKAGRKVDKALDGD